MFCCSRHRRRSLFLHLYFHHRLLIPLALMLFLYGPIFRKVKGHTSLPPVINIGAIFEVGDEQLKETLLTAVERINANGLLPRSRLNVSSHFVEPRDAFNGAKVACGLLESRVWAIISSRSEALGWLVGSLAAELAVPHLSVSWSHRESPQPPPPPMMINRLATYSRFNSGSSSAAPIPMTTRSAGLDPYYPADPSSPNQHHIHHQPIPSASSTSSLLENGDFAAPPHSHPLSSSGSSRQPSSPSSSQHSLLHQSSGPKGEVQSDQPNSRLPPVKPAISGADGDSRTATNLHRDSPASRNLNWLRRKYGGGGQNGPGPGPGSRVAFNGKPHSSFSGGDPNQPDNMLQQQQKFHPYPLPNTVNFYPDSGQLSSAFFDFVHSQSWKSFTLIYDHFEGLVRLKDLLRLSAEGDRRQLKMSVIRFPVGSPGTGSGPPVTVDNSQNSVGVMVHEGGMLVGVNPAIGNSPLGSASAGGQGGFGGYYYPGQPPSQTPPNQHRASQNYHAYPKTLPPLHQQNPQQKISFQAHRPSRTAAATITTTAAKHLVTTSLPTLTANSPTHFEPAQVLNTSFPSSQFDFELQQSYVYKKLLKNIKKSEHNFVLYLTPERAYNFLKEAHSLQRMTEYDNFLIATMDIHLMDLSPFANTSANITGFSLLNSMPADLEKLTDYQRSFFFGEPATLPSDFNPVNRGGTSAESSSSEGIGIKPSGSQNPQNPSGPESKRTTNRGAQLSTTEALLYDAVNSLSSALNELDRRLLPEEIVEPIGISCASLDTRWPFGEAIVRQLKSGGRLRSTPTSASSSTSVHGLTGPIAFDRRGHRVNFALDIRQLKGEELKTVGKWTRKNGIESTANHTFYDNYRAILNAMKNKELRITVPKNVPPYIYFKENADQLTGNDKFDGFCVDLLKEIAKVFQDDFNSDFKYSIQVVGDEKYGNPNRETGDWDGMMGELMRHQADLAIADLTATYQRETAVDFTMPFMNLGIAILFKKIENQDPELFSFLKPFSVEVWLYLASAFLGISILFWLLSRIAPDEWESPHPCEPDPLELENQFSIGNSLWFAIGSLMQQGSDLAPKAVSTRILAGFWWFFTLIIISSYTANLAASLTLSRMAPAISNVEDLAKQTQIQYGCKKGGSTYDFFASSNHSTYQRMYNTMEANQEVYINNIDSAIERVRKGGYAYLAESSTIEYLIQRKCDLYQVGSWLDNKGYGIATPTESPYRTPISNAIVVLQDRGQLFELKKRWWVGKGGGLCPDTPSSSASQELNIENVGGVFVVLGGGVAIGCLFGALEFIWKSLKVARDERDSIGKLIWLEIVRICTGGGSSRPVFNNQSSSTTTVANSSPNGDQLVTTTPNGTMLTRRGGGGNGNGGGHLPKTASFTASANGTLKMGDREQHHHHHHHPHHSGHPSPATSHFRSQPVISTHSPALANYHYDTPTPPPPPPPPPKPYQHYQQQQHQSQPLYQPARIQHQQNPTYGLDSYDSSAPLLLSQQTLPAGSKSGKQVKSGNAKDRKRMQQQQQPHFPDAAPKSPSSYSTMY